MILHEARELYDSAVDKVGVLTLRVEHAPGQLSALIQFLGGITKQAGVYFANLEHQMLEPVNEQVGEAHGEPEVQRSDQQPEAAEVGQGSEPEGSGTGPELNADAGGELAGTSGTGAEEGQVEGNPGGEDLRAGEGAARG